MKSNLAMIFAGLILVGCEGESDPGSPSGGETSANVTPTAVINFTGDFQDVSFDASQSSDQDGTISNYHWDFGDGETSSQARVQHIFQPGQYSVTLSVTDNDGATSVASESIMVEQPPIPEVRVTLAADNVTEGNGNESKELQLSIRLSTTTATDYRLAVRTVDDTAVAGQDYVGFDRELIIDSGMRQISFTLNTIGNDILQQDRRLKLQLHSPSEGLTIPATSSEVYVTIKDDDPIPELNFTADQSLVSVSGGEALLDIELSHLSAMTTQVRLSMTGTGRRGADYDLESELITIPPMTPSVSVPIQIIDDGVPRGGKRIAFTMSGPVLAVVGDHDEHSLVITGRAKVNDTGVQSLVGIEGEDALHGRDAVELDDSDGLAGFSFTKLDISGNVLPNAASHWVCIQDNVSGVVAEVKSPAQALPPNGWTDAQYVDFFSPRFDRAVCPEESDSEDCRAVTYRAQPDYPVWPSISWAHQVWRANNYVYTWYEDNDSDNGGSRGVLGELFKQSAKPISPMCAFPHQDHPSYVNVRYCNTSEYLKVMNTLAVCGFTDWRLPTASELKSIMNLELSQDELMDKAFMPNDARYFHGESQHDAITVEGVNGSDTLEWTETHDWYATPADGAYLTKTPSADNEGSVWCVDSASGETKLCHKGLGYPVRAVRVSE